MEKKVLPTQSWGNSEEDLLAKWADKASCYRWMHDKTEKKYSRVNMAFTIPVIVLSTLTGTANFGMDSIVPVGFQTYAQLAIGGASIIVGIISTLANFLQYAQGMEAHRVAGISWGKLHRKISVELALPRGQRELCMDFLLVCRSEMDRLIEQSPTIPDDIIQEFEKTFPKIELSKPEVCNHLEKTAIYVPKGEKMAELTSQAAFAFKKKKDILKEIMKPEIKREILNEIDRKNTPPHVVAPKEEVIRDLSELRQSGLVSAFINKLKPVITARSERSSSPEEDQVSIEVTSPSDTCPESEYSHEQASIVSDEAAETPSQLPQTKEIQTS